MEHPAPPDLLRLPKVPASLQFGGNGLSKTLDLISDYALSKQIISPAVAELSKDTPVQDVLNEKITEFRENLKKLGPSWRWKVMKLLPIDRINRARFLSNCAVTSEQMENVLSYIYDSIFPEDLLGKNNGLILIRWIVSLIYMVVPPPSYPDMGWKLLDSAPIRAMRSYTFCKVAEQKLTPLNAIQKPTFLHIVHFVTRTLFLMIIQFVEVVRPHAANGSLSAAKQLFYSKRGFNYWKKKEMNQFLEDYKLERVENAELDPPLPHLTFHTRIVATGTSMRPICPFKRSANWGYTGELQAINEALSYHIYHSGMKIFSSVNREIRSLKHFLSEHKAKHPDRRLYYIKADVSKCFANLIWSTLEAVLTRVIGDRSVFVACTLAQDSSSSRKFKLLASGSTRQAAQEALQQKLKAKKCSVGQGVFTYTYFDQRLVHRIIEIIKDLRFKVDGPQSNQVFRMGKGVPQGCVLSSRLAHVYLNDYEYSYFAHISGGSAMFRYADDYLFVLESKELASEVLDRIKTPDKDFQLVFRKEKTKCSFKCGQANSYQRLRKMMWCGNSIDTVKNVVEPRSRMKAVSLVMKDVVLRRMPPDLRCKHRRIWRQLEAKERSRYPR